MPKVRAYSPAWLSAPFPDGQSLFSAPPTPAKNGASPSRRKQTPPMPGPRRTVARRGTEVFVACGKEIRWADLVSMKSAWEATHDGRSSVMHITNGAAPARSVYRILKPPVADEIRQLVISPHNNFLAILTAHTVHICVLPDPSHLVPADDADVLLKTRYFTLGPTTHVTTRAPVVSALWHPLGVNSSALVTVTRDAVVRLWDISPLDRWSFDAPALAIDVKKLADGTWLDEDFGASAQTNAGYSPDLFDMEVAAAAFGPRTAGGWSSMTLWIAMLGGDVYALCPLLPKRWAPPPMLLPSLSVAVVANVAAVEDDPQVSPEAKRLAQQQLDWMSQLDSQEPTLVESSAVPASLRSSSLYEPTSTEVFARPSHPGIVPRLQGPFEVDFEESSDGEKDGNDDDDDDDGDETAKLCDILVIGEKLDMSFLMGVEEDADDAVLQDLLDANQEGLSLSVLVLVTAGGRLHICLDLVGVEAQWLPPRSHVHKRSLSASNSNNNNNSSSMGMARPLFTFQVVDVVRKAEQRPEGWCSLSGDVTSRYSFFVTHPGGITHVSLSNWVFRLEQELQEGTETGADFRVRQLVTGENTTRHRVYVHQQEEALATSVVLMDPDLGYFLLSATDRSPVAICFDAPDSPLMGGSSDDLGAQAFAAAGAGGGEGLGIAEATSTAGGQPPHAGSAAASAAEAEDKALLALDFWKARPAFEVPRELYAASQVAQAKSAIFSSRYQMLQHQQVRLSPATLNIFTNAHKLIGKESGQMNQGVSRLFTKLQDLPIDLHEQVESAAKLKHRIDMIAGFEDDLAPADVDVGAGRSNSDDVRLRRRLQAAQQRNTELAERVEQLRRAFGMASARPLSDKERAWTKEVRALNASLRDGRKRGKDDGDGDDDNDDDDNDDGSQDAAGVVDLVLSPPPTATARSTAQDVGPRVRQIQGLWQDLSKQAAVLLQKTAATARPDDKAGASDGASDSASRPHTPTTTGAGAAGIAGIAGTPGTPGTPATARGGKSSQVKIPMDVRKAKMAQVTKLLERETAMVDAVTERLERLGVAS